MIHKLPRLAFELDALEPHISARTLEYHHGKHHRGYVDKLNGLIKGTEFEEMPLVEIVQKSQAEVFNNAAQAWNHSFYWKCLSPEPGHPGKAVTEAIVRGFGSFDGFKINFADAATAQFGSGWVWLVQTDAGQLEIKTTSNADTPVRWNETPILVVDVWEHAYYLDYQNDRAKYVEAMWAVTNWEFAEQNLANPEYQAA